MHVRRCCIEWRGVYQPLLWRHVSGDFRMGILRVRLVGLVGLGGGTLRRVARLPLLRGRDRLVRSHRGVSMLMRGIDLIWRGYYSRFRNYLLTRPIRRG